MTTRNPSPRALLWAGDLAALAVLTLIGFSSHNELQAGLPRMLATFLPLVMAWLAVALPAGLMDGASKGAWQPAWAMLLAGPLAAVLRGFWLNSPVAPTFAAVLGATGALVMFAWRAAYRWLAARRGR